MASIDRRATLAGLAALAAAPAAAHHGWGSYDANTVLTFEGQVLVSKYENPHGEIEMMHDGKRWTCTLAPPFRMQSRGLPPEDIAVGKTVRVVGYPSRVRDAEMRAERIVANGKSVELR
jgi:hypothetical protein